MHCFLLFCLVLFGVILYILTCYILYKLLMQGDHVAGASKRKRADERHVQQKKASAEEESLFAHAGVLLVLHDALCSSGLTCAWIYWVALLLQFMLKLAICQQVLPGALQRKWMQNCGMIPCLRLLGGRRRQAKPVQKLQRHVQTCWPCVDSSNV